MAQCIAHLRSCRHRAYHDIQSSCTGSTTSSLITLPNNCVSVGLPCVGVFQEMGLRLCVWRGSLRLAEVCLAFTNHCQRELKHKHSRMKDTGYFVCACIPLCMHTLTILITLKKKYILRRIPSLLQAL